MPTSNALSSYTSRSAIRTTFSKLKVFPELIEVCAPAKARSRIARYPSANAYVHFAPATTKSRANNASAPKPNVISLLWRPREQTITECTSIANDLGVNVRVPERRDVQIENRCYRV